MNRRGFMMAFAAGAIIPPVPTCHGGVRVSVREGDPGYDPDSHRYRVYVDGVEVRDCFTADERTGEAWCYVRGADGKLKITRPGGALVEFAKRGVVRVVKLA